MSKTASQRALPWRQIALGLILVLAVVLAIVVHTGLWRFDTVGQDVYYSWVEGRRLLQGTNPYARILQGNMLENEKYATYFPLFYLLSALVQILGLTSYAAWIGFWRVVFLLAFLGGGALVFLVYYRNGFVLAAVTAVGLWLFNNWALEATLNAQMEFLPLFFLLLSLYWLEKRPWLALISFSASLALKQLGIFIAPLYLIWLWQAGPEGRWRRTLQGALLIAALPVATSLPFFLWQPEGFVRSILFSATRYSITYSAGTLLFGNGGLGSRLPILLLLGLVYLLAVRRHVRKYTAAMLCMFIFAALTPVLFDQYVTWFVALLIVAVSEALTAAAERPTA